MKASAEFEMVLSQLESLATKEWQRFDTRPRRKGRGPDDKANRVIFTIHEFIKQKTGRPNWSNLLELLAAAGLVKRRDGGPSDSPDRRIVHHLQDFQKHHGKEARYIRESIVPAAIPPR